jgi:hypothetical protein
VIRGALAIAAFCALLIARDVPPQFVQAHVHHRSVTSVSNHDQRPRFDVGWLTWTVPGDRFLLLPPAARSVHLNTPFALFPSLNPKGFHYNRPPPAS